MDVAYQDLVQKAKEMQLPGETTEQVRKAIAFMHTGGKMGERGDAELMSEVAVATKINRPRPATSRHDDLVRDPEDDTRRICSREELAPAQHRPHPEGA